MQKVLRHHIPSFLLAGILLFALFFRLYLLSSIPPGLHVDEISFGYNAYSILHTGKDEYNMYLPLILRSFDDYRPALLSYIMIPFIKILGLSIFSIRLSTVTFSFLTLFALYQTTRLLLSLSQSQKTKLQKSTHTGIALSVIFLYAISPWNIFLSRLAIDTNIGLALFMVGLWIFLKFISYKKTWQLFVSFSFFAISFYSYNGIKFFLPVFICGLAILFRKELLVRKKQFFTSIILFIMFLLPLLLTYRNNTTLERFTYLNFFTQNQKVILEKSSNRLLYDQDVLGKIFDNRRVVSLPMFISNYLSNLSPMWLYADDYTNVNYKTPDFGLLYAFELPLLIVGFYFIVKKHLFSTRILWLFALWIMTSIIPAAMTIDTPSAVRIYPLLPALLILEGSGLFCILQAIYTQNIVAKLTLFFSVGAVISISVLWFFHAYFTVFPFQLSSRYAYGVKDAILYAKQHENNYQHILISNTGDLSFSYLYYLFFTQYNPEKYLAQGGTNSGDFAANHIIGKYAFLNPHISTIIQGKQQLSQSFFNSHTLYILDSSDLPKDPMLTQLLLQKLKVVKTINFLDGHEAILILASKYSLQ